MHCVSVQLLFKHVYICIFYDRSLVFTFKMFEIFFFSSIPISDDRPLTSADQQRFAAHVGRDWKRVGRALQKSCRALKGPAIDNLAYEYEREGLYEQAYQLLGRFIQSEGRSAKLSRLISALEETKLTSMAEIMLGIQPRD